MSKRQEAIDALRLELGQSAEKPKASAASSSPAAPTPEQPGVVGRAARDIAQGVRDSAASVWRGATGAVTEAVETVNKLTGDPIGKAADHFPEFTSWYTTTFDGSLMPKQSDSTTGKLIESATQFGVGMLGVGKFLKAPAAAGTLAKIGIEALKGGIVDMTVFDEYGQRLSNILEEHPELSNPVTRFLKADPKDSTAEAKLKQGLEGLLSGVAFDAFIGGVKVLKKSRLLTDAADPLTRQAAAEELTGALKEADQILNSAGKYTIVETDKGFQIQVKGTKELHPQVFTTSAKAEAEAGTLNMIDVEKAKLQPPGQLSKEQVSAIQVESRRLIDSNDPADLEKLLEGTDFNYLRVTGEEDAKPWIEAISEVMRKQIDQARGGDLITHKKLLDQIADTFPDGNPQEILNALSKTHDSASDLAVNISAGRLLMYNVGRRVSELSKLVDGDPSNALNMARLGEGLDSLFNVAARLKGSVTGTARALEAMKMDVTEIAGAVGNVKNVAPEAVVAPVTGALAKEIEKAGVESVAARKILASLKGMTPDQMRTLARRLRFADGDPSAILAVAKSAPREATEKGFWDFNNEFWINAILSGPKTQVVNAVSNLSVALAAPVEKWAAGVFSGNKQLRDEGADLLIGNFMSLRDSWRGAWKTLKIGENSLDPFLPTNEAGATHAIGGYLGQLVRMPSRLLMSEDEFFKQMAYRSNIRMQALRDARELGLSGQRMSGYVQDAMNAAFRPDGRGANKIGLDYSRQQTFTTALDPESVAGKISSYVAKHPAARVIMPFVRTPANLVYYTWEHTPGLAMTMKQVRDDIAAGGTRKAMALTKQGTGLMFYTTAATMAYAGMVTGKGPQDPALRKQWLQSHQPYSVKIGDEWHEYKRIDPLFTPVGIAADMVAASGEIHEDEIDKVAIGFMAAVSSNLASKTYLAGITNAMEAWTSGSETKMRDYFRNQVGSYVPNALNQPNPDDNMREVRGYVDSLLARLPGYSTTLPARRNLFGEPVLKAPGELNRAFNPFTTGIKPSEDGGVEDKLLELGKAVPMPSKFAPGTDDLGPLQVDMASRKYGLKGDLTPYDRLLELTAEPGAGQPSLRKALTDLVKSPQWEEMSAGSQQVAPGGLRFDVANKIIQGYRDRAFIKVRQEFPEMDSAIRQALITKKAATALGDSGVERIQKLFKKE